MYAVIISGGKQHRVTVGERLKVELLKNEPGQTFDLTDVLLVANGDDVCVGAPLVEGARVAVEVLGHGRHDKIRIVKHKRRKHYHKEQGHRQWFTEIKITDIAV